MDRNWPAKDVEDLIRLIDDPRHMVQEDGTYKLSEEQARAILELRLQRLTAMGRDEIEEELNKIGAEIADYLDILRSRARIQEIVRNEMLEIKEEFATPRRTEIVEGGPDFDEEDLIQREDMVVTVSHGGYIKRVPLATYRAQRRGGKGRSGMATKDEDFVTRLFVANTHTPVLFFSSRGICYKMKVWRLPLGGPTSRGKALVNMLPLEQGEQITSILPLPEDEDTWADLDVMFATVRGTVRRNKLSDFVNINRNGKIAMKLEDGDGIVSVDTCCEHDDIMLTTNFGQCIRFPATDVRVFAGRNSVGVRGIRLADDDTVISMQILHHIDVDAEERVAYLKLSRAMRGEADDAAGGADEDGVVAGDLPQERYAQMSAAEQIILTISENGYGKRTSSFEYRVTGRGGKGITAMAVNDRNGGLIASFPVEDSHQIMLVTDGGQLIRCPVDGIRIAGRATQGVIVFKTAKDEKVVAVEGISEVDEDDELEEGAEGGAVDGEPPASGDDGSSPNEGETGTPET